MTATTVATEERTRPRRDDDTVSRSQVVEELTRSYWMELETVQNYLANSVDLDGIRAKEVKESLSDDVEEELTHARRLAGRIHILGGRVPGSAEFQNGQAELQPPRDSTDVKSVILGVIAAEEAAIRQYGRIARLCEGIDYVTQDLCVELMADEEAHRREFVGYLAEFDQEKAEGMMGSGGPSRYSPKP